MHHQDFIASSLNNSYFSQNNYNLSAIGGAPRGSKNRPDDFPQNLEINNTRFIGPGNNALPVAKFNHNNYRRISIIV